MLKYGFFDSINADRKYNARDISELFDGILVDGVFASIGNRFAVKPKSGMTITVDTGQAWVNHTKIKNTSKMELTVDYEIYKQTRYDGVVLEVNEKERKASIFVKTDIEKDGTYGTYSELTNDEYIHQRYLAIITVKIGNTSITEGDIENRVGREVNEGTNYPSGIPYVTAPLEKINADQLLEQWDSQWKELYADFQNELSKLNKDAQEKLDHFQSEFDKQTENNQKTFDTKIEQCTTSFNNYVTQWDGRVTSLMNGFNSSFNGFMVRNEQTFDTFMDGCRETISEAEQIVAAGAGGIRAAGSIPFEELPTSDIIHGWMYNITDDFTTDERFEEGAGIKCKAGTNVYWTVQNQWALFHVGSGDEEVINNLIQQISLLTSEINNLKSHAILDTSYVPVVVYGVCETKGNSNEIILKVDGLTSRQEVQNGMTFIIEMKNGQTVPIQFVRFDFMNPGESSYDTLIRIGGPDGVCGPGSTITFKYSGVDFAIESIKSK